MKTKHVLAGLGLVAAGMLSAATLNVELTVSHGVESQKENVKSRRIAYFVVDRSGSMDDTSLDGNRKPNDALLESLKLRLSSLPDGSAVHVIPFSSATWLFTDPCVLMVFRSKRTTASKQMT